MIFDALATRNSLIFISNLEHDQILAIRLDGGKLLAGNPQIAGERSRAFKEPGIEYGGLEIDKRMTE